MSVVDAVSLNEQENISSTVIIARQGASAEEIGSSIGIAMPEANRWTADRGMVAMSIAPQNWVVHQRDAPARWFGDLEQRVPGLASLSELTGAYRFFQLHGPQAGTLLQRGMAIDFHDSVFPSGTVALSAIAHIDVSVRCLEPGTAYEVIVSRSYAESYLRWFHTALAGIAP